VLLQDFHAERTAGKGTMSEKTMTEHKVAVRMIEEFLGTGTPAASITRADMLNYKRALMQTPANYRQRFPGLSLPDAITANAKLKTPFAALNPQTINNKWLSHVGTIMNWCFNNGLLLDNPPVASRSTKGRDIRNRRAWRSAKTTLAAFSAPTCLPIRVPMGRSSGRC
jgi:hypothetical protein